MDASDPTSAPSTMKSPCCMPAKATSAASSLGGPALAGEISHPFTRTRTTPDTNVGMRPLPGGVFTMGTDGTYGFPADGEGPAHEVALQPFHIDETTVTNEQFNAFANATGYRTESERAGWSFVFIGHLKPADAARLPRVSGSEWWCRAEGANWRHPHGPTSSIKSLWPHPVVQVSWHDALAFAHWAGKRLPTEAEWEFAARGGLVGHRFPWGDELEPDGKHRMNVWQGRFPSHNTEADAHYGTAPARSFRANGFGLYNMTGNVWEWCWDRYDPTYYCSSPRDNPTGPLTGERRVMRGGSYLCHASYCNRYRTDARSANAPDSATSNLGFRCVRDVAAAR